MQYRRFLNTTTVTLLCCTLLCGTLAHFSAAQVVHAYRKPNEADLQWLLGDESTPPPGPSGIAQAGFVTHSNTKSASECALIPHCEPCKPVSSPQQPIPPAPQVTSNKMNVGIASDEDGVINTTAINMATPVVQMAGERLPPPSEVPKEQNVAVSLMDSTVERLPVPGKTNFFDTLKPEQHIVLPNDEELTCSSHKKGENAFNVPDMLGSSAWLVGYGVGTDTMQFTLPTMLLTRPNVAEHFNAEVQNRIWADYRHWNNAVSINRNGVFESRAVEQFSFGLEKRILRRTSAELRVPIIGQFESGQAVSNTATAAELGNVSVFLKHVLVRNARWTISGGGGTTLPTAENWRSPAVSGRLNNNIYYLVSFLGIQWHPNKDVFGHFVVQTDLPIEKNELVFDSGRLKVEGQQVIRAGVQLGCWIYRNDCGKRPCRLGSFVEVDYAVVTDGTPEWSLANSGNTVYVSAFDSRRSTLTAAVGVPMVFGKLTCTNSVILPISGSDRPFSVGYNFSLNRRF